MEILIRLWKHSSKRQALNNREKSAKLATILRVGVFINIVIYRYEVYPRGTQFLFRF